MNIILGVSAGIAAYKVAHVVRGLSEAGHQVRVIPTESSLAFVGTATWEALSHQPVTTSVFENIDQVEHVRLGHEADLIVVAPASADLVARVRAGMANDLLSATILMASSPVVFVPAMHTEMWQNPATVENIAVLQERGMHVMPPASGRLTGQDTGIGRLPEPEDILAFLQTFVDSAQSSLSGKKVLISAGGTREPLDPVRFLGNRSSGKQGVALAQVALQRGAEVTVVGAHLDVPVPPAAKHIQVSSAEELRQEMLQHSASSDVVIMAAAVADYRPERVNTSKIKKRDDQGDPVITLVRNPDILAELGANRELAPGLLVGFAAETGDEHGTAVDYGYGKLQRKGADVMVVNEVGTDKGFGSEENDVLILGKNGLRSESQGTKVEVAAHIWDQLETLLAQ